MTEFSKEILEKWQVRKTKKQKSDFIARMLEVFPEATVEEGGRFMRSRNIILGDVEKADLVLGAHYDTCAVLPVPNFLTPKNILIYLIYSVLLTLAMLIPVSGTGYLVARVSDSFWLSYLSAMAVLAIVLALFFCGKPNKHTANDNTSGVITLIEIWQAMDEETRSRTAFVFFDNEENGLLGSAVFAKKHKKAMKTRLLINFDCVSDGDDLMLVIKRKAEALCGEALRDAYRPEGEKRVLFEKAATTLYPSDQANFPVTVAVASFKRAPLIGLYMDKIHTPKDTAFDERNIAILKEGTLRLAQRIAER